MTDDRLDFGFANLAADVAEVDLDELRAETDNKLELAQRILSEFDQK